jgi:hypothetical protein
MKYFPIQASGNIFKMVRDGEYQWKPSVRERIMDWHCKAWVEVPTNILELRTGNLASYNVILMQKSMVITRHL